MTLKTPTYNLHNFPDVYEPSQDTFLFLDALEKEIPHLINLRPQMAIEIGCGSGIVITALASILKNSCLYFCTDINTQACLASKDTAKLNNIILESVNMDLLTFFKHSMFDIILFNPPYVVTDSNEISGYGLNRAWAGGIDGREIVDRLFCSVSNLLTKNGVLYVVLLKENKPLDVASFMRQFNFDNEIVLERKIPGEHLYIYKFFRKN